MSRATVSAALALSLAGAVLSVPGGASADPVSDAERFVRRAEDRMAWTTYWDDYQGHNHFHLQVWDSRGGELRKRFPGREGEVRAEVTWIDAGGEQRVRRFSSVEREGFEPFSEGPLCCSFDQSVLVALPHDFGGVDAVIDFWAAFDDIPQACPAMPQQGACGGATEGFFNMPGIFLVTDPNALDAADARPELMHLH